MRQSASQVTTSERLVALRCAEYNEYDRVSWTSDGDQANAAAKSNGRFLTKQIDSPETNRRIDSNRDSECTILPILCSVRALMFLPVCRHVFALFTAYRSVDSVVAISCTVTCRNCVLSRLRSAHGSGKFNYIMNTISCSIIHQQCLLSMLFLIRP